MNKSDLRHRIFQFSEKRSARPKNDKEEIRPLLSMYSVESIRTCSSIQMPDQVYLLLPNNLRADDKLFRIGQSHYCQT